MKKKKFVFDVRLEIQELSSIPFLTGVVFCKVRQLNGGHFAAFTTRKRVADHSARWDSKFNLSCKLIASQATGILETCLCRVSVRKELKGGKSYEKLGYVDMNFAEFAGCGSSSRRYILEGYSDNKDQRQDNSILKVNVNMTLISGDPLFKPQVSKPQVASAAISDVAGKVPTPSSSKDDIPKDDEQFKSIPRSFSDSSQPNHLLPPMDGMSTFPLHKRHASVGNQPGRISLPTHTRSGSMDKRFGSSDHSRQSSNTSDIHLEGELGPSALATASEEFQRKMDTTRVDVDDVINQLFEGHDFTADASFNDEDKQLKLVVSRDGKATATGGYDIRKKYKGTLHTTIEEDDRYKTL